MKDVNAISINIYLSKGEYTFIQQCDNNGMAKGCKYSLGWTNPPSEEDPCSFSDCNMCRRKIAIKEGLEQIIKKTKKELDIINKEIEDYQE